ncbi:hybrid sensor histidine kinase/response regulator [Falsiroseomonas selenitidurans]|uniref:histidine kinase n=1 Tax=Falsiroseomonas selenitidurans TaxID=2716335 RepID=A0ABX1EAL4_9PROT|nr:PAS domain S-box protein [Falsiroseomonas selenitidurans]NKC32542.1 PAS domain S-box protein [Falsiroseomonas selenitidurans]
MNQNPLLDRLAECLPDGAIIRLAGDGRIASWPAAAQQLLGHAPDAALGQPLALLYLPHEVSEDRPRHDLGRARAEGRLVEEAARRHREGSPVWINSTLLPDPGPPPGFLLLLQDRGPRRRAQQALESAGRTLAAREAEIAALRRAAGAGSGDRFRQMVEAAPDAMVMVDATGRIEVVNAQAERIFGYAREEMLGRAVEMLVPARFRGQHPALRGAFGADPASRPMGAGRDLHGLRKDGSEFPVEIGLNPIGTEDGPMVLSAIVDISARRRQEERFRRVVEAAPNAMVMVNAAGRIEMVNAQAERVFGHAREEMLGRMVEMLVPARFRGQHPGLRGGFFHAPQSRPMGAGRDLFGLRRDGSEFPVEIGLNPIETEDGPMVLSSILDLSARVQLEALLRQAQKMEAVGRLTAGVAHDFNNLLQSMMGSLELLRDQVQDDVEAEELVGGCIDAAMRGARLTHHLLAFSRKQVLRPSRIEIAGLLRKTVAMLERTLGPNIRIQATEEAGGLHAFADSAQLEACILNLAINARDAMPRGGSLTIRAFSRRITAAEATETLQPGDYAVLAVEDTGAGIEAGILDKIFEPFFTTKNVGEGSGLGLPMVLGYARQSGGDVRVTSRLGQGTRVEVLLPRVAPALSEAAAKALRAQDGAGGHVLLVDDAPAVLLTLGHFLTGAGYTVTKASGADEAMRIVAGAAPLDCVVTDYAMPGMSGVELLVRVMEQRPGLPVLVVTGYPTVERLRNLPDHVQILRKPFLRAELLRRVGALIRRAAERQG